MRPIIGDPHAISATSCRNIRYNQIVLCFLVFICLSTFRKMTRQRRGSSVECFTNMPLPCQPILLFFKNLLWVIFIYIYNFLPDGTTKEAAFFDTWHLIWAYLFVKSAGILSYPREQDLIRHLIRSVRALCRMVSRWASCPLIHVNGQPSKVVADLRLKPRSPDLHVDTFTSTPSYIES